MAQQVRPADRRPLLFRKTTDYTKMAAHRVEALDGEVYPMLFMGTGVCVCARVSGCNCVGACVFCQQH